MSKGNFKMKHFIIFSLVFGCSDADVDTLLALPRNSFSGDIIWSADHETGDLSQWTENNTHGGSYDSGGCSRPPDGVSTEYAHTGTYSMKMTVDTDYGQNTGCRQFRHEESRSSGEYYYSVWVLFPKHYTINDWSNIIQFKSKRYDRSQNDAVWVLELRNRDNQ